MEAHHVRTQVCSNGTVRAWSWPMSLGEGYFGPKVVMTETKVKLKAERVTDLQNKERRTKETDAEIRRRCEVCWSLGVPYLGDKP